MGEAKDSTKTQTIDCNIYPTKERLMKQPDPKKHFQLSMWKSAVRIAAGISLIWPQSLILAGIFLILAEVIGVAEEMV